MTSLLTVGDLFGRLKLYSKDIDDLTNTRVRDIFVDSQRVLRNTRVRYDSPFFRGFRLAGPLAADPAGAAGGGRRAAGGKG